MESPFYFPFVNCPIVLYNAIDAGNLKRVKRLVKVKSLNSSQVSVAIIIAMNANLGKKVRNEIIQVFLSHPEIMVNIKVGSPDSFLMAASEGCEVEGSSVLHTWIKEGDLDLVKAVVAHPTFDVVDASKGVITAIESEHLRKPSNEKLQNDVIKTLLEHPCVDVNFKRNGFSLLHIAIALDQFKTVETLLRHPRIDVNTCVNLPTEGRLPGQKITPLIASMMYNNKTNDITKILLEHPNIDVNKTDADICLPLSWIVNNFNNERNYSCFELLLIDRNIDVNVKDEFLNVTPLADLAQRNTYKQRERSERNLYSNGEIFYEDKAFKLLLAHPKIDLEMKDGEGKNVLHHMIISILLEETDTEDEDLSHHRARFGSWYEIISELLKSHPSLITPDKEGNTPIDIAMEELSDPFHMMKEIIDNHFDNIAKETTDNCTRNLLKLRLTRIGSAGIVTPKM